MNPSRLIPALFAASLLSFAAGAAAETAGTVAVVTGHAEIGRQGAFWPAEPGMAVEVGDELRTGDGRLRVVLRDDSVINLGENTHLVIDEQVFKPEESRFNSLLRLIRGRVRSAVGSYYQEVGAAYEVETATAVAGVRGTTFVVEYDAEKEVTEVLGISGRVAVRSRGAALEETVYVGARQATTVDNERAPTSPEILNEDRYRRRLEGLEIVGRQGLGGLVAGTAVQSGSAVAPADRAPLSAQTITGVDQARDASDVVGQPLPVVGDDRGRLGVPF